MKVEIQVPSSLSEITLEQYQKFAEINTDDNQDSSFLMHKTVEVFCNLNLKDIAKIKYIYVQEILNDINNLFDKKQDLIHKFKHKGVTYGFIPVLDDMTLGEYVDLDENFTNWETMHKAMAVLYRPITLDKGNRYQIEEYDGLDNADLMKGIPLDVVMGCMFFFYNLNNELLKTTLNYLNQEVPKELTTEQLQTLAKNGDGINQSMESLKEMLQGLNISLN
jgi:molecular chaperone GrpE (heat shock protein)